MQISHIGQVWNVGITFRLLNGTHFIMLSECFGRSLHWENELCIVNCNLLFIVTIFENSTGSLQSATNKRPGTFSNHNSSEHRLSSLTRDSRAFD